MNRLLQVASLVMSIAALAVALSGRPATAKPDPELIRKMVDGELQRRETELVASIAPKFRVIYNDMLGPDAKLDERALNPKTIADLLKPLVTIIEKMGAPVNLRESRATATPLRGCTGMPAP